MDITFVDFVNHGMSDIEYRTSIVHTALDNRHTVSPQTGDHIRRVINERVQVRIKGFDRNRGRAPTEHLLKHVVLASMQVPQVFDSVLRVWREARNDLKQALYEYLRELTLVPDEQEASTGRSLDELADEDLRAIAEHFSSAHPEWSNENRHPEWDEYDAILMLYCILGHVPRDKESENDEDDTLTRDHVTDLPVDAANEVVAAESHDVCIVDPVLDEAPMQPEPDGQEELTALDDHWAPWLAELEMLSPDSAAWDSFSAFLSAAQGIMDWKREERQNSRETLRRALETLLPILAAQAEYFEFIDFVAWDAEQPALAEVPLLAGQRRRIARHYPPP